MLGIGHSGDQDRVGSDVAVPMVLPLTGKRVFAVARCERPVICQFGQNVRKLNIVGSGKTVIFSRLESRLKTAVRLILRIEVGHQTVDVTNRDEVAA